MSGNVSGVEGTVTEEGEFLRRQDLSESHLILEFVTAGGRAVQVRMGDLTGERTDAIVNAANGHLMHGGGVAGAIRRAGGSKVVDESEEWVHIHGVIPNGGVAHTTAGNMPSTFCIHAVGPVWSNGQENEPQELYNAVSNSLKLAVDLNCKSIALPAISSGIFGFPKPLCAQIMFQAVLDFLKEHMDPEDECPLREIRFTNFDRPTVSVFSSQFQALFLRKEGEPDKAEGIQEQEQSQEGDAESTRQPSTDAEDSGVSGNSNSDVQDEEGTPMEVDGGNEEQQQQQQESDS